MINNGFELPGDYTQVTHKHVGFLSVDIYVPKSIASGASGCVLSVMDLLELGHNRGVVMRKGVFLLLSCFLGLSLTDDQSLHGPAQCRESPLVAVQSSNNKLLRRRMCFHLDLTLLFEYVAFCRDQPSNVLSLRRTLCNMLFDKK